MAKPPTSTRTIRLPDELWATIKADAEAREETVNGVIARHLRVAYRSGPLKVQAVVDVTVANRPPTTSNASLALRRAVVALAHATVPTFVQYGPNETKPGDRLKKGTK